MLRIANKCPYCGGEVVFTSNSELYGTTYGNGKIYLCRSCKASVGTHRDGRPLGILANEELKVLKQVAHSLFDPYWKSGRVGRSEAYKRLAKKLGIAPKNCHFGHFDKPMLLKVIKLLTKA